MWRRTGPNADRAGQGGSSTWFHSVHPVPVRPSGVRNAHSARGKWVDPPLVRGEHQRAERDRLTSITRPSSPPWSSIVSRGARREVVGAELLGGGDRRGRRQLAARGHAVAETHRAVGAGECRRSGNGCRRRARPRTSTSRTPTSHGPPRNGRADPARRRRSARRRPGSCPSPATTPRNGSSRRSGTAGPPNSR